MPPPPGTPGLIGWHELHTTDLAGALAFYQGQFGWQKSQALDMGPAGVYQLFSMAGEQAVGGMLNRLPDMPRTCWLYYFNVAEIGAAISRVRDAGGTVLMGPREVPGGGWIAQCLDPQGAAFALWGPKSIS
jgi:predicted enzyme related to lactoylglutathione lyase